MPRIFVFIIRPNERPRTPGSSVVRDNEEVVLVRGENEDEAFAEAGRSARGSASVRLVGSFDAKEMARLSAEIPKTELHDLQAAAALQYVAEEYSGLITLTELRALRKVADKVVSSFIKKTL